MNELEKLLLDKKIDPTAMRLVVRDYLLKQPVRLPVPDQNPPAVLLPGEAALYKQAENTLGDPHKI